MARSMASIVACSSTNLARASTVFSRSNGAAMIFAKARQRRLNLEAWIASMPILRCMARASP